MYKAPAGNKCAARSCTASSVGHVPNRLVANRGKSFQGSNVLGKGFILSPEQAQELIDRDSRNKDVLFPYLNGEDLNSRPDSSASRWVINFHDWPEEQARSYPEVFDIVERLVKPIRAKVTHSKNAREKWWQYERRRPELYSVISNLDRVLVVARISRTAMVTIVPTGQVVNEKIVVFASDRPEMLAILDSTFHTLWAWKYSATLKSDLQYAPSDVFETLPLPDGDMRRLSDLGARLEESRRGVMASRDLGLTKLYNLVHDKSVTDLDICQLRGLHEQIDCALAKAYGWTDMDISHAFFETRQGLRYTVPRRLQSEMLDRLLELNHERYGVG